MAAVHRFDRFVLDPGDRQLLCDGRPLELNSRYLDALILLVSEEGRLVSKERFLAEVWRGVPVTDEALTQGIKTLRRQLGDDASRPRFIETVPKHGYRFIAPVVSAELGRASAPRISAARSGDDTTATALPVAVWGTFGGGLAGLVGGLFYGFVGTSRTPGEGAISVLLVLVCLTMVTALMGAASVALGIATARRLARRPSSWDVLGGAAGGMIVGAVVKLIALDSFGLLLGRVPRGLTGAPEGLLLGAAVGLGAWLLDRWANRWGVILAGLVGALAGLTVCALGGRLMGGSLALVAAQFPGSQLNLAGIGALLGEAGFGPLSATVTGTIEGLLFSIGIAAGMLIGERRAR